MQTTEDGHLGSLPPSEEGVPTVPGYARIPAGRESVPRDVGADATLLQRMGALIDAPTRDDDPFAVTLNSARDRDKPRR